MEDLSAMEFCDARTRTGGRCRRSAGHGTEHLGVGRCTLHGGSTPGQVERARRQLALREMAQMGGAVELEPTDALLACVHRAAGQAAWLRLKVEDLRDEDLLTVGAHGTLVPHTWIRMEQEALDRLARVSKMALDGGVAERAVQFAERTGELLAAAFADALAVLELDPQREAEIVGLFTTRLRALEESSEEEAISESCAR